jgi:2-polyprenyl-3-methyl-5-hydroxy-6-metoxy-1,4-benzoquinol methylase
MAENSRFWDRIAEKYSRQPISDQDLYLRKLTATQAYLSADDEVFEFGCGTGGTALEHAPFVRQVTGIDVSSAMIRIAKEKQAAAGVENVDFQVSGIDAFVDDGRQYDAVLGLSILHLVEDPASIISKVGAMMKPGGVFVSSTFCAADHVLWLKLLAPLGRAIGKLPLLTFFTYRELVQNLQNAGFSIETEWRGGKMKSDFIVARKIG